MTRGSQCAVHREGTSSRKDKGQRTKQVVRLNLTYFVLSSLLFPLPLLLCPLAWGASPAGVGQDSSAVVTECGKPVRVGGWRIEGDSVVPLEKMLRGLPRRGTEFTRQAVDRAAASILSVCENNGYPFTTVTPLALVQESGFVYPALRVEAGPKVEFGFIEFAGRPGTKPEVMVR